MLRVTFNSGDKTTNVEIEKELAEYSIEIGIAILKISERHVLRGFFYRFRRVTINFERRIKKLEPSYGNTP